MRGTRGVENESRLVEITSRTLHGRYLLRPSPKANDLILGVLGRAQRKYEVTLYGFIFMSNHFHMLMNAESVKQMARFLGFLKGNVAKELGFLYGWNEKFWGRRYSHDVLGDDPSNQLRRLNYLFQNGCKEGLVRSPLDWPGVSSAWAQLKGATLTGTWYDRSSQYRASLRGERKEFPSTETVTLSPLPVLANHTPRQQREAIAELIEEVEFDTKKSNHELNRRPLGQEAIQRQDPHAQPAEFHPSPAPKFHAATPEEYWKLRNRRKQRESAYRTAAERLKQGQTDVQFPEDCFPPGLPFVERKTPT